MARYLSIRVDCPMTTAERVNLRNAQAEQACSIQSLVAGLPRKRGLPLGRLGHGFGSCLVLS
jgi:hypothetical protein